ncbi:MAG: caspase family protein, partial [Bacteroidota bacterium]
NGEYQDYELHNPTHLQVLLGYNFTFKRKKDKEIDELKDMLSKILEKQESQDTLLEQSKYRGSGDPLKGLNVSEAKNILQVGNYYAFVIGIDKYKGTWALLNNAVNDAKAVEELLKSKYKFDHLKTLYDEEATGENIIKELEWLVENVKEQDNVFIYYSGHGEFKESLNKGYWVPVDAQTTSTYKYISNSDIQTFMGGIKSKHTLLISDACFSGDIFRGTTISVPFEDSEKYYKKVHNLKSRQAITSGGLEPVMDGGNDGHSVFTYYLLKALNDNNNKYYDSGSLYNDIKIPVTNNSDQSPKLQPIKNTKDEGGQFIFIKK